MAFLFWYPDVVMAKKKKGSYCTVYNSSRSKVLSAFFIEKDNGLVFP